MTPVGSRTTEAAPAGNRHPLRKFWGDVVDINAVTATSRANKPYTNIVFDMANIDILEANEPYTFPTTQISIPEFSFPGTAWEACKASIRRCGFSGSLDDLIGKRVLWDWSLAPIRNRNQQTGVYEEAETSVWQIVEIEGVANTGANLIAISADLANGKDEPAFRSAFLANGDIRGLSGYGEALVQVMRSAYLDLLVQAGQLTVDTAGIYHKIG